MITAETVKQQFYPIKLHFSGKYDYWKYNGQLRTIPENKKQDMHFIALARKLKTPLEIQMVFATNMAKDYLTGISSWIGHYKKDTCVNYMRKNKKFLIDFEKNFADIMLNKRDDLYMDFITGAVPVDVLVRINQKSNGKFLEIIQKKSLTFAEECATLIDKYTMFHEHFIRELNH